MRHNENGSVSITIIYEKMTKTHPHAPIPSSVSRTSAIDEKAIRKKRIKEIGLNDIL